MTAKIYHADLYGTRSLKYKTLLESDMENVDWHELSPNVPFYLFLPQEQVYREEYECGWGVNEIFPVNALGLNSHRDDFAIAFSQEELVTRMAAFRNSSSDEEAQKTFGLINNRDWNISDARMSIRSTSNWQAEVVKCLYRPFDFRYCFLSEVAMDYPRLSINSHMQKPNLSVVTSRQTREPIAALATNLVCGQHKITSVYDGSYVFPLWLYPQEGTLEEDADRQANLNLKFVAEVKGCISETPVPEDIFYYAYAVFHAPTYRTRYAAFLKTDFPRLPLPPDAETFHALAALGKKLVALHLLEDPSLNNHGIAFNVPGSHEVKKMRVADRYVASHAPPELGVGGRSSGRVRLNDTEYFDNVPPEAWEFRVGGYQPAAKWLDDRAGRILTADDITHYRRMIAAMRETAALLTQVDAAFLKLLTESSQPVAGEQAED